MKGAAAVEGAEEQVDAEGAPVEVEAARPEPVARLHALVERQQSRARSSISRAATAVKHIRQLNQFDCGLATAAMLSGRDYWDAVAVDKHPEAHRGLSVPEMRGVLSLLTPTPWSASKAAYGQPLASVHPKSGALLIRATGKRIGHWVAWDGATVYDPELPTPQPLATYSRADWLLVRTLYAR